MARDSGCSFKMDPVALSDGAGSLGLLRSLVQILSFRHAWAAAWTGMLHYSLCWISFFAGLKQEGSLFFFIPLDRRLYQESSWQLFWFFFLELFQLGYFFFFFTPSGGPVGAALNPRPHNMRKGSRTLQLLLL